MPVFDRKKLREAFDREIIAGIAAHGPGFNKAQVIKKYVAKGPDQATVYRWYAAVMSSGRPGVELTKKITEAVAKRAAASPDPVEDAARDVVAILPKLPRIESIVDVGAGPVIDELKKCLNVAWDLMAHARKEDGRPKNAKLLLQASEHLRRVTETMIRLQEAMNQVVQVESFQQAVFDVLREESPPLVERVLKRLRYLNEQWRMGRT
jgi:hypothetical protein